MSRFVVVAGGGTAGHVHPGLAVAHALVSRGHSAGSILYVGSDRGIEHDLVPPAGFDLVTLPGEGIPRKLSLNAVKAVLSLAWGSVQGLRLLRRERPSVVLALGGFAAVPCALAARALRIPVVIHEQNAVPGAANRFIARWARAAAVSFEATPLPHPVLTGNPVRSEMLAVDRGGQRGEARAALGLADHQVLIVVTGGSLGSLRINKAALEAAEHWHDRSDIVMHHVVGQRDWELLAPDRSALSGTFDYRAIEYENNMPLLFGAADLAVSRAGASIVAELAAVGLGSILVPLPGAPGDHQTANASALVTVGAAIMVVDEDFDGNRLVGAVEGLVANPEKLTMMGEAARAAGCRDAADRVAQLLEEHAK